MHLHGEPLHSVDNIFIEPHAPLFGLCGMGAQKLLHKARYGCSAHIDKQIGGKIGIPLERHCRQCGVDAVNHSFAFYLGKMFGKHHHIIALRHSAKRCFEALIGMHKTAHHHHAPRPCHALSQSLSLGGSKCLGRLGSVDGPKSRVGSFAKRIDGFAYMYIDMHGPAGAARGFEICFVEDAIDIPRLLVALDCRRQ